MKTFSVLIVDDEPIQRKIMRSLCEQSLFFETIVDAKDAVEALSLLNQSHFDLMLLDINMPLLSGLSLAKTIPSHTKVIFVTAYSEHAVEAFELNVLDYLLKPVSFERFLKAIQKLHLTENTANESIPSPDNKRFISLKQGKRVIKVKLEDIHYCEARGNNTFIYLADKTHIDIYSPLTKLLEDLPNKMFTRVHRSFIVNNTKVKAVDPIQVHLINDAAVPVGASYKGDLKNFEL